MTLRVLHRSVVFVLCGFTACAQFAFSEEISPPPPVSPATPVTPVTPLTPVTPVAPVTPIPATQTVIDSGIRPLVRRGNLGEYTLVWSDEFNGEKLDATLWECRSDSRFWSTQKADNDTVSGGYLHVHLKKEKAGKLDYTGGGVISKRNFRYGYYEASIKCPPGKGWHTSFCLTQFRTDATGARQTIEVCETDSIDLKSFAVNLISKKPIIRSFGLKRVKTPDLASDFHVWGCEFTPQKARYFFDGDLVASIDANEMVHDDQSIWISCIAAPLAKTFHVDDSALPAEMLVDWVRFYEKSK